MNVNREQKGRFIGNLCFAARWMGLISLVMNLNYQKTGLFVVGILLVVLGVCIPFLWEIYCNIANEVDEIINDITNEAEKENGSV